MEWDGVIVGGGLVGASLACALKNQPFRIALIDQSPLAFNSSHSKEARALALSYTSIQCLKTMGIWDALSSEATAIKEVHVSKKRFFGTSKIRASDQSLSTLGHVVSADDLHRVLIESLDAADNIQLFRSESIDALAKDNHKWQIKLKSGEILGASLLIGADGAESQVRKYHGLDIRTHDYQQTAIVANVTLVQANSGIAYERFLPKGSIALLPFGQNQLKSVWVLPTYEAAETLTQSNEAYLEALQHHFGFRAGRFCSVGQRMGYPLKYSFSENVYGDGFVLIGNAANTLHPIAAQGFNLGLRDVSWLAELLVIERKKDSNASLVSLDLLSQYASRRQSDHQVIRYLTDRLADSNLLQWLGITACEWVAPIKKAVMQYGLGRQQDLPKLCRGVAL